MWGQDNRLLQCNSISCMIGISVILFKLSLRNIMKSLSFARLLFAMSSRSTKTLSLSSEEWKTPCLSHFTKELLLIAKTKLWRDIPLNHHSLRSIQRTTCIKHKQTIKLSTTCSCCEAQASRNICGEPYTIGVFQNLRTWWKPNSSNCNSEALLPKR
jgi:hypothetical protein